MELDRYLEDLERRIDPEVEDDLITQWRQFCRGECESDVFVPRRLRTATAGIDWPRISVNAALDDLDAMVLQQFRGCVGTLSSNQGRLMMVRANYGVPILAMPFGTELFMMSEQCDTLPNCHPLGTEKVHALAERGVPSLDHEYLQRVWAAGRRFAEIRRHYPKIAKYVPIYHPDFQGPMDVLELIWGSDIFIAFVDEPEFIHRMLRLITDLYLAAMLKWQEIVPPFDPEVSCHWGLMMPGQIMVRDDSAMNLPPEYFREFIQPYDQELLNAFGGGAIHACGRLDHYTPMMHTIRGLKAMNMSQPHLNDVEKVLHDTIDQGILLLDLQAGAVDELQQRGRPLRGRAQAFR